MVDPQSPGPSQPFWRCGSCDTPNPGSPYVAHCVGCGKPRPVPGGAVVEIRPARGRVVGVVSWLYAAVVLLALGLIRWVGDAWWGTTLLLFMPRWLFLFPLPLLALAAAVRRGFRHWVVQGATALVVAGPLMGLSIPVARLLELAPAGDRVRVATFNTGSGKVDLQRFDRWIEGEKVDVIGFQEVPATSGPEPGLLHGRGWHVNRVGTIASRFPIVAELEPLSEESMSEERFSARLDRVKVRTPTGREFVVASVHMPTIRPGLTRGDVDGLRLHLDWWGHEMGRVLGLLAQTSDLPVVMVGDFNMPSDDARMAALRASFQFAFEEAGWGYGYTRPSHPAWVRIDHVLTGPEWYVAECWVGPDCASDHLPLLAELLLPRPRPRPAPAPAPGVGRPEGPARP
jgi:vancomycin resistance protein VanJ